MPLWDLILKLFSYVFSGLGGTVAAIAAILVGVYFIWRNTSREKYDVFLAIPMAAANEKDVAALKALAGELVGVFQNEMKLHRVYCAWLRLKDDEEEGSGSEAVALVDDADAGGIWDPAQFALPETLNALKRSNYFVLVYPEKQASSVLVEAGMALSFRKPSVWFVRDKKDLPFLLRNGEGASNRDGLPNIKVYVIKELKNIKGLLRTHKQNIFGMDWLSRALMHLGLDQK